MNEIGRQFEIAVSGEKLLERVISILEQARANVVKAVNSNMVIAYWLIGREIVHEIQQGQDRAAYGKKVLAELSDKLTKRYGEGFSVTNLRYFRLFFQTYRDRNPEIRQSGKNITRPVMFWKTFVPLLDMGTKWTDEMLYKRYGITDEEIAFIESKIRPMEVADEH